MFTKVYKLLRISNVLVILAVPVNEVSEQCTAAGNIPNPPELLIDLQVFVAVSVLNLCYYQSVLTSGSFLPW